MKALVLLPILCVLFSCQKEKDILSAKIPKPPVTVTATQDTVPDNAGFKLRLFKDSVNYDETMIMFKRLSSSAFSPDEDAAYLQGFGEVSLASISSDCRDLAIYSLPYTPGMAISLDVHTKHDGLFTLKVSYETKIPAGMRVWVKDTYRKDSCDVRNGGYTFRVSEADTNSFGNKRFRLILAKSVQQAAMPAHSGIH